MKTILVVLLCILSTALAYYETHHPKYEFDYGVKDPHTGDHKSVSRLTQLLGHIFLMN